MRGMRVVKAADERKLEILTVAQRLFLERGYDVVTVSDILTAVGISKGAFYHHFTSKDEVLIGVTEQMAHDTIARVLPVLENASLTPLQKLNAFFAEEAKFHEENLETLRELVDVLFRDENLRLRLHVTKLGIDLAAPHLAKVLAEGVACGQFDLDDPYETARIVMQLGTLEQQAFADAMARAAQEDPHEVARELGKRMVAYERAMERLMGVPKYALSITDPAFVERFFLLWSSSPVRPRKSPNGA